MRTTKPPVPAALVVAVLVTAVLVPAVLAGCAPAGSPAGAIRTSPGTVGSATAVARPSPGPAGPSSGRTAPSSVAPGLGATPAHVVVVVMENHAYDGLIGNPDAPWLNRLPGALFTNWSAVAHPSQPNYLALFSGSTQGVTDDRCPLGFDGPNLGSQLIAAGLDFVGYSEGLPSAGDPVCRAGRYARKHAPWTDFRTLPGSVSRPFSDFPVDFTRLPRLAFVIPDMCHDTHDCSVAAGDGWLADHLGPYATWATTHNSLLVLTYDEDDDSAANHIVTLISGAGVRPGRYPVRGDHYTLLRTLEALFGLPGLGQAATRTPVDLGRPGRP